MGVFEMIVLVTVIGTVGKVVQSFAGRRPPRELPETAERIRRLESELQATELRVSQAEEQVADLDEKLRFVESLLAPPPQAEQLPRAAE